MKFEEFKEMFGTYLNDRTKEYRVVVCVFQKGGNKVYDRIPCGCFECTGHQVVIIAHEDLDCPDIGYKNLSETIDNINIKKYGHKDVMLYDGRLIYKLRDSINIDPDEWRILLFATKDNDSPIKFTEIK